MQLIKVSWYTALLYEVTTKYWGYSRRRCILIQCTVLTNFMPRRAVPESPLSTWLRTLASVTLVCKWTDRPGVNFSLHRLYFASYTTGKLLLLTINMESSPWNWYTRACKLIYAKKIFRYTQYETQHKANDCGIRVLLKHCSRFPCQPLTALRCQLYSGALYRAERFSFVWSDVEFWRGTDGILKVTDTATYRQLQHRYLDTRTTLQNSYFSSMELLVCTCKCKRPWRMRSRDVDPKLVHHTHVYSSQTGSTHTLLTRVDSCNKSIRTSVEPHIL